MSLTRKFLTGMGLTAEQVDAIIDEHANTVDSLKEQRDSYKEDAEKLKDVTKELNSLKKQVEDGSAGADEWKDKYEKEHKAFEDFKKEEKAKETIKVVRDAYTKLLKDNKVGEKHIESILNVTDFSGMKLKDDGSFDNADKLVEGIKEKWSGFITETSTEGSGAETPPKGTGSKYGSKSEIMKIKDTQERQAAIKNNPELFNG